MEKIVLNPEKHLFFNDFYVFLIALNSIGAVVQFCLTGQDFRKMGTYSTIEGKHLQIEMRLPVQGTIESLIKGVKPDHIELDVLPKRTASPAQGPDSPGHQTVVNFSDMINSFSQSMFLNFYEREKEKIKGWHGNHTDTWPSVWRFAWLVRNAISHDGKVTIYDPSLQRVTWRGLEYSSSDNGTKILGDVFTSADILRLMLDMNDLLQNESCPA